MTSSLAASHLTPLSYNSTSSPCSGQLSRAGALLGVAGHRLVLHPAAALRQPPLTIALRAV